MVEEIEEWRWIPGFEGRYEASSLGRVRSHGSAFGTYTKKPRMNTNCYLIVDLLCDPGPRSRPWPVHRLVAMAFFGDRKWPEWSAAHNNGVPWDNRVDNIRWATHTENMHDKRRHGTEARGERHGAAKLSDDAIREIRRRVAAGEMQKVLAKEFGVSPSRICTIVKREAWTHVS